MTLAELKRLNATRTQGRWCATWDNHPLDKDKIDETVWTVGPNSNGLNWETDSSQPGYGILRTDAEFIAALVNSAEVLIEIAEAAQSLKVADGLGDIKDGEQFWVLRCQDYERLKEALAKLEKE